MNFEISKSFQKSFNQLKDQHLATTILSVIDEVSQAEEFTSIRSLQKLKGHKTAYRIRAGNYRIGVFIEPDASGQPTVIFAAFSHRKDIYKRFP
ncbi:MAG: hypothetical protein WBA23_06675 [Tunicatimonas sp.]|uniref:type II toxin-antitoxin system RelE family toxin n=1 Tax=Tunicatimonas sp. TaxID=1940096 RepID=UPI003C793967